MTGMTNDDTERLARIAFAGFVALSVAAAAWVLLLVFDVNVIFGKGYDAGVDAPAGLLAIFPLVIGLIGSAIVWTRWLRSAK